MVVSLGQCMASLDLGTKCQGMISGVGTLARLVHTGQFSVLRCLGLRTATGLVVLYAHLCRSAPAVPLEPRVEFCGTEPFGGRHYRLSLGRQWGTVESTQLEREPFVSTHCHCDHGGQYGGPGGRTKVPPSPWVGRPEGRRSKCMAWSSVRFV